MKKIISAICALALSAAMIPAAMADGTVEIRFRVGDSVLSINGNNVEVETPYIAGDGTTLVPIRVISEAFGANVGWDGATQTVTVEDGGKKIVLQIGNKTAVVNGVNTGLLEAPQLTENGYTMVPLRFISETLGAAVGYDNATQDITVSRTSGNPVAVSVGSSTMTKREFEVYFDSYLVNGWSIERARNYALEDVRTMLAIEAAFNAMGLSFTEEELAAQAQERARIAQSDFGGEDGYNAYLVESGLTDTFVRRMIAADYAVDKIFASDLTPESVEKYYKDNYLHAKHILVSTVDTSTMTPYDEAEIATRKSMADGLLFLAQSGEDFDVLVEQYSEDPGSKSQPGGYYFTAGEMVKEFEDTTRSLGINEIGICESVYGYHIIKRLPLEAGAVDYSEIYNRIVQNDVTNKLPAILSQYGLTINVNQAVVDSVTA